MSIGRMFRTSLLAHSSFLLFFLDRIGTVATKNREIKGAIGSANNKNERVAYEHDSSQIKNLKKQRPRECKGSR